MTARGNDFGNNSLSQLAFEKGILIGAAIEPYRLNEPDYAETLSSEFSLVTSENTLKWSEVHPEQGRYSFDGPEQIIGFAERHGMKVKGHTLIWHSQNPGWLVPSNEDPEHVSVKWTKAELEKILHDHIATVVGHFAGRIQYWDVVNEPFSDDQKTNPYRQTFWYRILGPDYIEKALQWTHEADPSAKLFINDYGNEEINPKSDSLYSLVKELKAKGVPIDGIGMQMHLNAETPPDYQSVEKNVQRFTDLGLEVHFSEIDVGIKGDITEEKLKKQADVYQNLMVIAARHYNVTAYITWGVTDRYSWLNDFEKHVPDPSQRHSAGLLFDTDYQPKPAYYSLKKILQYP